MNAKKVGDLLPAAACTCPLTFQNCDIPTSLRSMMVHDVSISWPLTSEHTGSLIIETSDYERLMLRVNAHLSRKNFSYSVTRRCSCLSGVVTANSFVRSILPSISTYIGRPSCTRGPSIGTPRRSASARAPCRSYGRTAGRSCLLPWPRDIRSSCTGCRRQTLFST